jgi:hypothetical protein
LLLRFASELKGLLRVRPHCGLQTPTASSARHYFRQLHRHGSNTFLAFTSFADSSPWVRKSRRRLFFGEWGEIDCIRRASAIATGSNEALVGTATRRGSRNLPHLLPSRGPRRTLIPAEFYVTSQHRPKGASDRRLVRRLARGVSRPGGSSPPSSPRDRRRNAVDTHFETFVFLGEYLPIIDRLDLQGFELGRERSALPIAP